MMRGMRALILDGHSRAALECAQSLGRRGAYVALACDTEDCTAFRSRYVHERLRQPGPGAGRRALEWLRNRHAQHPYDFVIPTTDLSLQWLRALAEAEPLRVRAVLPPDAALDAAMDRQAIHDQADALDIPVPANVLLDHGGTDIPPVRYPVVLKATRNRVVLAGRERRLPVALARDKAERGRFLAHWLPHTPVQQQEVVCGRGFGIAMLLDRGSPLWHFAHERVHERPFTGAGSSYRRSIAPPPRLLGYAERLLRRLQWHGVALVEFRGPSPENARLMGIKPRLWGSLALSLDCGVDFPWGLALIALEQRVPAQPRYRIGYYSRNLLNDASWQLQNWRADRCDALLPARPRWRVALELLRPLLGRESWDHFDWKDTGVTAHLIALGARAVSEQVAARLQRWQLRRRVLRQHRRLLRSIARKGRPERLLFLCQGNICHSPLAAQLAKRRVSGIEVRSAGLHRAVGREIPPHLRKIAAEVGIDLGAHRSRRLARSDVERAELILCMDLDAIVALERLFPQATARVTLLGLFASPRRAEIADPHPAGEEPARAARAVLQSSIDNLCEWLCEMPRVRPRGLRSLLGSRFRVP
jgi:protein-tyrosine-phosphatase/predicted ATP-grasp superfamily ATP-dependent carboligase